MTPLQLKVIYNACVIRIQRGEDIEEILNSYPKLTFSEYEELKKKLSEFSEE